jgi:GntR family transcriptional regulator, arabinose operon transcriptional repressor
MTRQSTAMIGPATSKELVERVRKWIADEGLKPGAKLPSSRSLADDWKVGRTAMNYAILQLVFAGAITRDGYKLAVGAAAKPAVKSPLVLDAFIEGTAAKKTITKLVERWGMELRFHDSRDRNRFRKALLELLPNRTSGVLIDRCESVDLLQKLEDNNIPVIVLRAEWPEHSFVATRAVPIATKAVGHLVAFGHVSLVYLAAPKRLNYPIQRFKVEDAYPEACRQAGLPEAAQRMIELDSDDRAFVARTVRKLLLEPERPTALLCENIKIALATMAECAKSGHRVPADVSVLCLFDHSRATRCIPAITALGVNAASMVRIATLLLLEEVESRAGKLYGGSKHSIYCEPGLILRDSTGPAPGFEALPVSAGDGVQDAKKTALSSYRWPDRSEEREALVKKLNERIFTPLNATETWSDCEWVPLDLGEHARREFKRNKSWLGGEPLRHFRAGKRELHGVPFTIKSEILVLRSLRALSFGRSRLPSVVILPVGLRVESVFILHATGWMANHRAYGNYLFHYAEGISVTVPIIGFGTCEDQGDVVAGRTEAAITQDWHSSYPQFSNARALPYLITGEGDPLNYERYLYTYRFINPHPEKILSTLQVEISDPEQETTHAVLAITAQVRR